MYGALTALTLPGITGLCKGSAPPEFLLVLIIACSKSESAVAFESVSASSRPNFTAATSGIGGGDGDRPREGRLWTSSGDRGGVLITTFFLGFELRFVAGSAERHTLMIASTYEKLNSRSCSDGD